MGSGQFDRASQTMNLVLASNDSAIGLIAMKTRNLVGLTFAGVATLLVMRKLRPSPIDLSGQVVLITGSSRGLGFILARELARQGCDIVICARDPDELEQVRAELAKIRAGI